jgi:PPOX class probable F420-dependent enzyme
VRIRQLAWAGVRTEQFDAVTAFFRDVLGLAPIVESPAFCVLTLPDGSTVEVFGSENPVNRHLTTGPVVGFLVDDVLGATEELRRADVEILLEPDPDQDGRAWTHFRAPDGTVWELTQAVDLVRSPPERRSPRIELPEDVRALLAAANYAHVATVLPDGTPHSVPVWVGLEGDHIAFLTSPGSRKARNLARDERLALSITDQGRPTTMAHVRGRVVRLVEGDEAWQIIDRISDKYIGQPYPLRTDRVVFLIEAEHAAAQAFA